MAVAMVGYLLGRRRGSRSGVDESVIGSIQASILGMLALMLGFTFGIASARYDARRVLAVDESNAIGTTFLRAQTLPEPYRTNMSNLLRKYVDLRLESASKLDQYEVLVKYKRDTESLQQDIWKQAAAVAKAYPSDITGLFEESLNQSIDLFSSRIESFTARVPNTILWILALISCASLGIVGYGFGIAGQRGWLIMLLVSAIIAIVIVMIVDLDKPEAGPTRISNQTMVDLRKSLAGFELRGR